MKPRCVDSAGHAIDASRFDPQRTPLSLDIGRNGRKMGVPQHQSPQGPASASSHQFLGFAVKARARRLDKDRYATDPAGAQARGNRLPKRLMRVDEVDLMAQTPKCAHHPGHERGREKRAPFDDLHPTMNLNAIDAFVTRQTGSGTGHHMNVVTLPHQFAPLLKGLALSPAL
jgi:hypothetical protein